MWKEFRTSNVVRLVKRIASRLRTTIELQASPIMTSRSSERNTDKITFVPGCFAARWSFQGDAGSVGCEIDLIFLSRFLAN